MDYRKAYGLPERYFLSLGRMVEKKNLATLVSAYGRYVQSVAVAGERLMVKGNGGEQHGAGSIEHGVRETADGGGAAATKAENCKLNTEHRPPGLVFVGSGELEGALREQARGLGLRVIDRTDAGPKTKRPKDEEPSLRDGARRSRGETERPQKQADDWELTTDDSAAQRGAVYFYGFRQIEENPVFYALAEAFILPSLKEEWGLVVNEAMAAGLPVIVSRTAGCAEDLVPAAPASRSSQLAVGSVQSGENADAGNSLEQRSNGFVFDPKSCDALSEALRRIADQKTNRPKDKETDGLTEMGRRSREIVAKFSCENFARQALLAAEAAGASVR